MSEPVTTLSTDGQVTLPKSIRDGKRWAPGTRLVIEDTPDGVLIRGEGEELYVPPTTVDEVAGILRYDGPPVSIEEMNEAIEIGVRERSARGRY